MRRFHRPLFAFVCILAVVLTSVPIAGSEDRPNVLWITAEDMSPTLGCYGDNYATTPHIDNLAKNSVRYTQVFATAPVCSPVRSCLITGCYATSLGTQRLRSSFPIPDWMTGFPAYLRKTGYYCTNNVKTDYNTSNEKAIISASWDENSATAHWRNRKVGQPFFSVFNHMVSHQSRTMVWPYEEFQQKVQSKLAPAEIHDPSVAPVPPYYPDTPLVRKTVARFYDCVTVMDKQVGELLRQLKEDGLAEDTIIFFFSDHGSGMPRHKRVLLDSGMHVPLLVHVPEKFRHLAPADSGTSLDRLVSFVDFPPSLLSLCGLPIPKYMQGAPFLGPAAGTPRNYVFGARDRVDEVYDVARSVRDGQFLYIRNFMPHLSYHQPSGWPDNGAIRRELTKYARNHAETLTPPQWHYLGAPRPVEELYDVTRDPQNLLNLADSPAHRAALNRLRKELRRWILDSHDCGFLSEAAARERAAGNTPFDFAKDPALNPVERLLETASHVGQADTTTHDLTEALQDEDACIRRWAAIGFAALGQQASASRDVLQKALQDPSTDVRIEAAYALARAGFVERALPTLINSLEDDQPGNVLLAARTIELLGPSARGAKTAMQAAKSDSRRGEDLHFFVELSVDGFLRELKTAD